MFSVSTRPRLAIVALAVVALTACVDNSGPTEVHASRLLSSALGDVILVTNTSGGNVAGSIRQALIQATGGEVIRFDPSIAGAKIVLDTTLEVPKRVTIEGPADKGIILSGNGKAGVLHVHEGATLVNLTITEGKAQIIGGGILAEGPLVLDHTTVSGNEAGSEAGIRGDVITLINSTVTDNKATAALTLGVAGGISYDFAGGLTMTNSTVSHNTPSGLAGHGNGSNTPTVKFDNAIVSNNGTQNCVALTGAVYSGRNISDDHTCGGSELQMIVADPLLQPLADNGGPTFTRALGRTSPAINATDCATITVDQRYVARDAKCDIGAFEFVFTAITLTINPNAQVDPKTGAAIVTGTLRCSRDETFDLGVEVAQDQRAKRIPTVLRVTNTVPVVCGTTAQPWIASLTPPSGQALEVGAAVATASSLNIAAGVTPASTSTDIRLAWTKGR